MPRKNNHHEKVVVETVHANETGLVDNKTFEDTVVKVEVYESERALTRALDDYTENCEEERRLVRKIDRRLIPALGTMFFLQSMDRTGMHGTAITAKARQLYRDDMGYASVVWIFFALYIGVVVNSNIMLSRARPSRYLPALVLVGGIINSLISVAGSARSIVAFRFPITVIEAVYFPGVLYVLSCWYKPAELGKRIAMFPTIAIVAQIVGSIMTQMQGSERNQILNSFGTLRYMFFTDGVLSVLVALVSFYILPDYPAISRGFSRRERELAIVRLIKREQDTGSAACRGTERLSAVEAIFAAMRDPRVIVISMIAILTSAAGTASHMLLTSTIQTGYSSLRAHRLAIPTYLLTALLVNVLAWTSDRTRDRRWHIHGALTLAVVGAATNSMVSVKNPIKVALVTLFTAGIWSSIPLVLTWAAVAIKHPAEKRAVVLAIVHSVSGAACVFGVQMWPKMLGRRQHVASAMSTTFLIVALLVAFLVPEFVRLDSYRGTRAERDQALRRHNMEGIEEIEEILDS